MLTKEYIAQKWIWTSPSNS